MRSLRLPLRVVTGALMLLALRAPACVDNFEIGRDALNAGAVGGEGGAPLLAGGAPSEGGKGGDGGDGGTGACTPVTCQGKGPYACGDCMDNDQDGDTDAYDIECTGPCDNTEDSFHGGIPGQNNAPCRQDCYFDSDTGSGTDGCYWTHECDELSVAPDYPPSGDSGCEYDSNATVPGSSATCAELASTQSEMCDSVCRPVTPNGCDCFGCCELPARSGKFVFIGSTIDGRGSCDESNLADTEACRPCTPVPSCLNECEPCEHCVGGMPPDSECGGAGGEGGGSPGSSQRCEQGVTPCGQVGEAECPAEEYCITGCCIVVLR